MIALILTLLACSDTDIAHMKSMGESGHITCFSGGQIIYEGDSTGKIATVEKSDGWEFMDAKTDRLVRVSGDCLIRN